MKQLLTTLLTLFAAASLFATTYHTVTIDGTNDFAADEQFNTTSGGTLPAYVTWDASDIFIGFSGNTPAGAVTDGNRVYHIYMDTDPQAIPTNGTGTTAGESWRWAPTLPFTANYHYVFKTIDNSEFKRNYSGAAWGDVAISTSNWKGSGYWELRISRADLGNPTQVYLLVYVEEDWGGGNICGGLPSDLFTNTTTSGAIAFNNHWLGYDLTSGIAPNATGKDTSLPVELTSFIALAGDSRVTLKWNTASELNNQGFIIERRTGLQGDFQQLAGYETEATLRGAGSSSESRNYQFTDRSVINGQSYWYRLADVDMNGHITSHHAIQATPQALANDLSAGSGDMLPQQFSLQQNFPNPFNPSTSIQFDIPDFVNELQTTELAVYDLSGRKVRSLLHTELACGTYQIEWDGLDANGVQLPSGVYFYTLTTLQFQSTKKMVLVR